MIIGERLGKFEHEVLELTPQEIARWVAYFKIQQQENEKAMKKARARKRR